MKNRFIYIYLLLVSCHLNGQQAVQPNRAFGQVIVKLSIDAKVDQPILHCSADLRWERVLAPDWQVHLYSFDERVYTAENVLSCLNGVSGVEFAQLNWRATDRAIPNDSEWFRQTNMELIKAPAAWDLATGGLTAQGDTIVVAVLEKGYYREHPDYQANRWYNHLEIPDNNLDDDQNGYIDDFRGYNPRTLDDNPGPLASHGTGVTGIVGAKGNNTLGIAGVNWSVRLMNLSNVEYENEIIDAYYYVYDMRKLYNTSNKQKGAFVVSTNASFGLDREKAIDHPLWCNAYDSLGRVGIISVGATSNSNIDVDQEGDMPTHCGSPYLITVTNVNAQDFKQTSGFGAESIDMGAPGSGTVTTSYSAGQAVYAILGGTSSAAPHVTGAVSLIYSMPCAPLTEESVSQPTVVAERVRDLILNNLDANLTLANITKYGGRLNLAKPLTIAKREYCSSEFGELMVEFAFVNNSKQLMATGTLIDNGEHRFIVSNTLGQIMYEEVLKQDKGNFSIEVETSHWAAGMYFAAIIKGKHSAALKFLKF